MHRPGCGSDEVEWHHFGPQAIFEEEADKWGIVALCRKHHQEWGERVTPSAEPCTASGLVMPAEVAARPSVEDRIRAALWFAERGFGVFSVWSTDPDGTCRCGKKDCDQPGKHPVPQNGFKAATTDPAKIRAMLSAGSEPNWGMLPPEGVFALDVDGEGVARLAELEAQARRRCRRRCGRTRPTASTCSCAGRTASPAHRAALRLRHALGLGSERRLRHRSPQRPRLGGGLHARGDVRDRRAARAWAAAAIAPSSRPRRRDRDPRGVRTTRTRL